jgi:hypothetical protein
LDSLASHRAGWASPNPSESLTSFVIFDRRRVKEENNLEIGRSREKQGDRRNRKLEKVGKACRMENKRMEEIQAGFYRQIREIEVSGVGLKRAAKRRA